MIICSFSSRFFTSSYSNLCSAKLIWESLGELIYHFFGTNFLQSIFDRHFRKVFLLVLQQCSTRRTNFRNWRSKIDHKNIFRTNVRSALPEILSSPWLCRDLRRMRCRIWRRRNIWSQGITSLPLLCISKRRTKRRNWRRKNSGPRHQRRQGSICFSFSMSFSCTFFFSLPHPRTWPLPQK